jgi:NAD(P)-dependent dehydrogenase (short-subunit alcohol dehydrogenase family)
MSKIAVVAGVGPGLGAALVRRFAREGCRVAMLARSSKYLEQLSDETNGALGLPTDVSVPDQVARAFAQVRKRLGPVDILVYNASASVWRGIIDLTPEQFEQAWRSSVYGAFLCCQEVVADMIARKSGVILFTGATSSIRGRKGALDFSSAKFALRGLADSLARELWPKQIHVAHILIDGIIGKPQAHKKRSRKAREPLLDPDAIADGYWKLAEQDPSAWTFELELRPNNEQFFV